MKLHTVIANHGGKLWCAHAAMSAITGRSTKDCLVYLKQAAKEIDRNNGRIRRLQSVYNDELLKALNHFAYEHKSIHHTTIHSEPLPNNTLRHHTASFDKAKVYLIVVPWHYVVIQNNILIDSQYPEGINVFDCKHIDRYVMSVWEIRETTCSDL